MARMRNWGRFGELVEIETWIRKKDGQREKACLLRSNQEDGPITMGHYVLGHPNGGLVTVSKENVAFLREVAKKGGFRRWIGNEKIVEKLRLHETIEVLWWKHDGKSKSFMREPIFLGSRREQPLDLDDMVILSNQGDLLRFAPAKDEKSVWKHGRSVIYHAISRALLDKAHPGCALCLGTGVFTAFSSGRYDLVCDCTKGRSHFVVHQGVLREVRLDRYQIVVITAGTGQGKERFYLPERFLTHGQAKKRLGEITADSKYQSGSKAFPSLGPVVVVCIEEELLPDLMTSAPFSRTVAVS